MLPTKVGKDANEARVEIPSAADAGLGKGAKSTMMEQKAAPTVGVVLLKLPTGRLKLLDACRRYSSADESWEGSERSVYGASSAADAGLEKDAKITVVEQKAAPTVGALYA